MALYNKYRPSDFDEMFGNEDTIEELQGIIAQHKDDRPHSHLFYGPTGAGKTTLGRILAKKLGCHGADYIELDSADFRGIDTVRAIRRQVSYRPMESDCRVWLLDEAHAFTGDAANALLKVLEEPPPHVYFILCTTVPQKLLPTIRSRCSQHPVTPLTEGQMRRLLRRVVKAEDATLNKPIYEQIVKDSLGLPRRALTILEQVLYLPPERQAQVASKVASEQSQTLELCRALLERAAWKQVRRILAGLKEEDPEAIRRQVLGYCQAVLMKDDHTQAGAIMEAFLDPFYDTPFPQLVYACYSLTLADDSIPF